MILVKMLKNRQKIEHFCNVFLIYLFLLRIHSVTIQLRFYNLGRARTTTY